MTKPVEPSWTPHPFGREEALGFEEGGDGRTRLGLAFGLGAVVGVVASVLLSGDDDRHRTRIVRPLRFVRPRAPAEEGPTPLSEVAKEEAADLIRGLFREVGGTLIHWAVDYATRPVEDQGTSGATPTAPPPSPTGSTESPEAGAK